MLEFASSDSSPGALGPTKLMTVYFEVTSLRPTERSAGRCLSNRLILPIKLICRVVNNCLHFFSSVLPRHPLVNTRLLRSGRNHKVTVLCLPYQKTVILVSSSVILHSCMHHTADWYVRVIGTQLL